MIDVVMPQMGESIVEATLTRWLKKPGDKVNRDEPLFEISTDKVDSEIPSPVTGVLSAVLVEEGKVVAVNAIVARIEDGAATAAPAPAAKPAPAAAAPAPPPAAAPVAAPPVAAPPVAAAPIAATGSVDVIMPQMGESITEATLTKWLKKPGDTVKRDEALFEISTDKVDSEVPSPVAGVLSQVMVQEGATVGVNAVVAKIAPSGSAPAAAPAAAAPAPVVAAPAPAAAPTPSLEATDAQGPLSPLVRKMAREYSIDLAQVPGTGAGGRITKQDVENYMAQQGARTLAGPAPVAPPAAAKAPAAPMAPVARAEAPLHRVEPMSIMRQAIANHMVMSEATSVHVTTVHKVDMTKIVKLRDKSKAAFQERYGFGLTFLPFIMRATAEALRAFPTLNASIEGKNVVYHGEVNLGIAVALDGGLIVPVIRHADELNVTGLQRQVVDLANRARSKQLKPQEVAGGTFSLTNFGSFGSLFATPIINQPQVAILGLGAINKEAVVVDDAIAIRSMMYLALTFDHRLIDGALADQFCQKVKAVLEGWSEQVL
ncbi:MAG: dihydrolipoyllysine-residue succinyltransferase [Bryobacteraceae bacterium]|nr:dihydrolipoyllysine-residue succinyltransferase [Bryobacteraceae bacterium]